MGISFGSINTGLPPNIVKQIVDAERAPLKQLEVRKEKVQTQLKLVDDLTGKVREIFAGLRELAGTRGFSDIKIDSGDPNIVRGSAEKGVASPGTYMVEVMKLAHKTSAVSNGFPDKDETQVGVGYIRFYGPTGDKREIYIDNDNNTLEKMAKVINSKGLGLQASVVPDRSDRDYPWKLMITGKGLGENGGLTFPKFYFLDGDQDFFLEEERPAQNGKVKVDGFEFDIEDNTLKDVIPGVTLELRQAAPGREVMVSIGEDKEVITGKIKSFIDQVNGVFSFIQQQNTLDQNSDTTKTLGGDALLRQVESRFREILQRPQFAAQGSIKYLADVGVSFNRGGTLNFDQEKFNAAISRDLPGVQEYFVGDNRGQGLIPQLRMAINGLLDNVTGPLTQRSRGMKTKIEQMDQQIANKERMLAQRETTLKSQFARLEETMSKLNSQKAFIQQRLGGADVGGINLSGAT
ncbi:MAG: flagellar filament capping protein FliD [Oligoflexia bacterium]|nr:flagellar filament capping protein FliD [Oligoflexia bacterium]